MTTTSTHQYPLIFVKGRTPVGAFIPDEYNSEGAPELSLYLKSIRSALRNTRDAYSEDVWKKGWSQDKQDKFVQALAENNVNFVPQAGITGILRSITLAPCVSEKSPTIHSKTPEEYLQKLRDHPARLLIFIDSEVYLKTANGEEGYCSVTYCVNIFSGHMMFGELLPVLSAAAKAGVQAHPDFGTPITLRIAHTKGTGVDNRERDFLRMVLAMGEQVFEPDCLSYAVPVAGIYPDFDLIRENRDLLDALGPQFRERNPDASMEEVRAYMRSRTAQLHRLAMDRVIGQIKEQSQEPNPPAPAGFTRSIGGGSNFSGSSRFAKPAAPAAAPVAAQAAVAVAPVAVEPPAAPVDKGSPTGAPATSLELEDDYPF